MPCPAWGISAMDCKTGSKLSEVPGTTCSTCYARKGRYRFANVRNAQDRRLKAINEPGWVSKMAAQILLHAKTHFRWFDSGDVQSTAHALQICQIATMTPEIQHWCPTQELKIWKEVYSVIPPNLTVRLSGIKIGKKRQSKYFPTSMTKVATTEEWKDLVKHKKDFHCPAPLNSNKCGECRLCWEHSIRTVVYKQH